MALIITQDSPFVMRDFRQGRYSPAYVSNYLVPANSVSFSRNVNFDTRIGSVVVRNGTTLVGATVASGKTPIGFSEAVGTGGSPNLLLAVFTGASNATLYYFDTSWHTSGLTTLNNANTFRFTTLGGRFFVVGTNLGMNDSVDGNTWGTSNSLSSIAVSLVYRYSARLLAAGSGAQFPSRVYFSSVVSLASTPIITWNNDGFTGDWIDINPDDGGYVTGFAETLSYLLVFKTNGIYRLNVVAKSTDTENLFNVGAPSQEAIVACQGIVYFFSGIDIRQTDGTTPQQISRLGVQDIIDAIPQSNWASVSGGTDGLNVYFSVGNVTIDANKDTQRALTNVVLKYSPRDQSWSIHTYANYFKFFSLFTDSTNGRLMRGATTAGDVQTINLGMTDNTASINYELETQDIEFSNRAHLKKISDKFIVFTQYGQDGVFLSKCDGEEKNITMELGSRINICQDINLEGHWFNFKWIGTSSGTAPILEGFSLESVTDEGIS